MKVLILRSVPVPPDPKPLKVKKVLKDLGNEVVLISWKRDDSWEEDDDAVYFKLKAPYGAGLKNIFRMIAWQIFLLLKLSTMDYDVVHAFDLDTGLVSAIVSRLRKKRFIYEILDPFSESRRLPKWMKKIVKLLENWVCKVADEVIVVDENRLESVEVDRKKVHILRNVPEPIDGKNPRCEKKKKVLVYVGILQRDRGIIEAIEAVRNLEDWEFWVAGFGELEDEIKKLSREIDNLKFLGKVDYERALELEACSDAILITYDPSVPNNKRSSPNKFFEALMLKKPVIVSERMGIDRIVKEHRLGKVVKYGDVESLRRALEDIDFDPESAEKLYKEKFSWESFVNELKMIYSS